MPPTTQAPSESDVLAAWVRAGIAQIHTSFPATIIVYDPVLQKATVQAVVVPAGMGAVIVWKVQLS